MANPQLSPGSASVAQNLANADKAEGLPTTGHEALTTRSGGVGESNHPDPSVLGLDGTVWVSLAMAVFLLVLVVKKVPALIAGALDRQIGQIRQQLDDAKALRAEAEALRDDYARKLSDAEGAAADMIAHAEQDVAAIVAKAEADAADLIARRRAMADDKIGAAERAAIAEVRAKAAEAAAQAAASLLGARLDAAADKPLVDRTIARLGRLN